MEWDWDAVRAEYISGTISYRALAAKHNIPIATLERKAKKEKWVDQRRQMKRKVIAKTIDTLSNQQVARATRLQAMADKLLNKAEKALNDKLSPKDLRSISRTLLDIKELQDIRPDIDKREQEARIANLEKQAANGPEIDPANYGVVMLPPIRELTPPEDGDEDA